MKLVLNLFVIIFIVSSCSSTKKLNEEQMRNSIVSAKKTPVIAFDKINIKDKMINSKFYQKDINFYNKGAGILEIDSASASCNCSSVKVIRANVQAMSFGTIQLNVNAEGFYEQINTIKFKIYSNAINSPIELFLELEK